MRAHFTDACTLQRVNCKLGWVIAFETITEATQAVSFRYVDHWLQQLERHRTSKLSVRKAIVSCVMCRLEPCGGFRASTAFQPRLERRGVVTRCYHCLKHVLVVRLLDVLSGT